MQRIVLLAASFGLLLGAFAPIVASQDEPAQPVEGCLEMCTPESLNPDGPAEGASSVKTILYAHCADIMNRCPVNTQPLTSDDPVVNAGWNVPTLGTGIPVTDPVDPNFRFVNNWFSWFSSMGLVEYGQDGKRREHPEPGLADRIEIVGDTIWLIFYLGVNPVPGQTDETSPGESIPLDGMAGVGVYARMELSRNTFKGKVVAEGDTADMAGEFKGPNGRATLVTQNPDQGKVYEFKIPLRVIEKSLPSVVDGTTEGKAGFLVTFNFYQAKHKDATDKGGWQFTQQDWRFIASPEFPPRLIVEHTKPLVTKSKSLTLFDSNLYVRWTFISPWGSYDPDPRSVKVEFAGPTLPEKALTRLVIIKYGIGHEAHFKPINVTWKFEQSKAGLADGQYVAKMSVLNLQGTYHLVEEQAFTVSGGNVQGVTVVGSGKSRAGGAQGGAGDDAPGLEASMLVVLVLALAAGARRRRA